MSYQAFASHYDQLMSEVSYPALAQRLNSIMKQYKDKCELVLDVACGTGSLTWALAGLGYEVIGVDHSEGMLALAQAKSGDAPPDVASPLFLRQDICQLDLYGTVDVAVCTMDSLNHLEDYPHFCQAVSRIALFLEPGGLFLFDVNTEHKHRHVLADNAFVYETDNLLCIWRNALEEKTARVDITLDFFTRRPGGAYTREGEAFSEWIYTPSQIETALRASSLTLLETQGESGGPPHCDEQRILYITRKE